MALEPKAKKGTALRKVYDALRNAGSSYVEGQDWQCVAHQDNRASLGVAQGQKGVLLKCQAGCTTKEVLDVLGLRMVDLFDNTPSSSQKVTQPITNPNVKPVGRKVYDYVDEQGSILRKVKRVDYDDGTKRITQELFSKRAVLWHLPDVLRCAKAGGTIVLVEGEKSALRIQDVGIPHTIATCNPGGAANGPTDKKWLPEMAKSLLGAGKVLIVADNDTPGFRHARVVRDSVKALGIPVEVKVSKTSGKGDDIVDHLKAGYTFEKLDELDDFTLDNLVADSAAAPITTSVAAAKPVKPAKVRPDVLKPIHNGVGQLVWPHPNAPAECARYYIQRYRSHKGKPTLIRWRQNWYVWDGHKYRLAEQPSVRSDLFTITMDAKYEHESEKEGKTLKSWTPNTTRINNVTDAVGAFSLLSEYVEIGSYVDGRRPGNIIAFANGNLDFASGVLSKATPKLFNLSARPYPYDPGASSPIGWLKFLHDIWPEDETAIRALQEWFGYCLTDDTSQEKFMVLVGAAGSGKSTIASILQALLGEGSHIALTLDDLGNEFGLQSAIGKNLLVVNEALATGGRDSAKIVSKLKAIVGRDEILINRKGIMHWSGRLPAKIMMVSNQLPAMRDNSDALGRRLILLETKFQVSEAARDTKLAEKLVASELPGILLWALEGLTRLNRQTRFTTVESSKSILEDFARSASPVKAFFADKVKYSAKARVTVDDLYKAYVQWCEEDGQRWTSTKTKFTQDVHEMDPLLISKPARWGEKTTRTWHGIKLNEEMLHLSVNKGP